MKKLLTTLPLLALTTCAMAQSGYDKPYYLPGEGMYLVGLSTSTLKPAVNEPTLVTQAYKAHLNIYNTELASIKAGTTTYNLANRISDDATDLDLVSFMGVGNAYDLTVRDMDGNRYQLGDNAPNVKWYNTRLLAAQPDWKGQHTLPLCRYDQWDCPITYERDPLLDSDHYNTLRIDFGNPIEGLVATAVSFPLVCAPDYDATAELEVAINIYNEDCTGILEDYKGSVRISRVPLVSTLDDGTTIRNVNIPLPSSGVVINTPFEVIISGFAGDELNVWLPRAIDNKGIYPTHTAYVDWYGEEDIAPMADIKANSDAVVNIEGYFNYIGTWGWWDGKYERGEVVSSADLVQIYYDPSEPDWPGDYFMGEAGFPIECTFGAEDITIYDAPDWINAISYDESQWEEYGCVQITMAADALPNDMTGRNGKVVLCTRDRASFYTIYIRQGAAWFNMDDDTEGIDTPLAPERQPMTDGALYDMRGRRISTPVKGQPYMRGGKTYIDL